MDGSTALGKLDWTSQYHDPSITSSYQGSQHMVFTHFFPNSESSGRTVMGYCHLSLLLAGEYDLRDVRAAVALIAGKWKDLGISLGLHPGDLDGIQPANADSSGDFLRMMLSLWLKQSYDVSIFLLPSLIYLSWLVSMLSLLSRFW